MILARKHCTTPRPATAALRRTAGAVAAPAPRPDHGPPPASA